MPLSSNKNKLSFRYEHYTQTARLTTQSWQKKKKQKKPNKRSKIFTPTPAKFQHTDFVSTLTFLG